MRKNIFFRHRFILLILIALLVSANPSTTYAKGKGKHPYNSSKMYKNKPVRKPHKARTTKSMSIPYPYYYFSRKNHLGDNGMIHYSNYTYYRDSWKNKRKKKFNP